MDSNGNGGTSGNERSEKPDKKAGRGSWNQTSNTNAAYAGRGIVDCDSTCFSVNTNIMRRYEMNRLVLFITQKMRNLKEKLNNNKGMSVIELILILVVIIGLVIIFKTQLTNLVESIFAKITSESAGI